MSKTVADLFSEVAGLVRGWGFTVVERPGWENRRARADIVFDPKAVVNHHTASWKTSDDMLYRDGNGRVPAPLCHFSIDADGVVTLGAAGYANHAGSNNRSSVETLIAGPSLTGEVIPGPDTPDYSGNRRTVGIEVKCPGAYNAAQRAAAVALNAALVLAFGWDRANPPVGAHKEITRRKPGDPGDSMAAFRADVVAFIAAKVDPAPTPAPTPAPVKLPTLRLGSTGAWVRAVQRKLGVSPTSFYGPVTRARVKRWQKAHQLAADGIAGPKTLTALGVTSV